MSLSKRQQLFIKSYCENPDLGQTAAAKAAGCGKRAPITACEWMRRPEVIAEIQRRMNGRVAAIERRASNEVTKESVLDDMAELEESIKHTGMGAWQSQALLKIIEMRGKFLKMFTDRVEVGLDDDLIAKLIEGRKRAGMAQEPPTIAAEVIPALPEAQIAQ